MISRISWAFLMSQLLSAASVRAEPWPVELRVLDWQGARLEGASVQASLSRTLPEELGALPGPDRDALRFLLIGPPDSSLDALEVLTSSAQGRPQDVIVNFRTEPVTCPDGVAPEQVCRQTPPLRLVADAQERNHPALKARSLRAEVGGSLRVALAGRRLLELAVAGPRRANGSPIGRLRARLRVLVLRGRAGGAPAVGGTDAGARRLMAQELATTAALWGQCGLELGPPEDASIELVDPPKTQLLAVGCGLGQPAAGGAVQIKSGPKTVTLETRPGESPISVASRLAQALGAGGKTPQVFENQRAGGDAVSSADVLLAGPRRWQRAGPGPLSSDASLPVCLGEVDLSDGVTHFGDNDAFVGTLEERALLRSFDDGDPRSVEVLVVPELDGGRRIGESFIVSPGSSLSNSVLIDRSAIEAGARSFALAHELGHVLLAMPGHPDDFGVDQSWSLMDADVADGSIFGPRRLSLADCERMVTQTGPTSLTPLLEAVPPR
jgi:hypothetical protein